MLKTFLFLMAFSFLGKAKGSVDHINIGVTDLDRAAAFFSKHGFTLKKPHIYKHGHQKGLTAQAIRFQDGTYLQLVSPSSGNQGDLNKWYQDFLKGGSGGAFLVLRKSELKKLRDHLKEANFKVRLQKSSDYEWLSFKTDSVFQGISFIKITDPPKIGPELLEHKNGVTGVHQLTLRAPGPPEKWADIMRLTHSMTSQLHFSSTNFDGHSFIKKVILHTSLKRSPDNFSYGDTEFIFKKR